MFRNSIGSWSRSWCASFRFTSVLSEGTDEIRKPGRRFNVQALPKLSGIPLTNLKYTLCTIAYTRPRSSGASALRLWSTTTEKSSTLLSVSTTSLAPCTAALVASILATTLFTVDLRICHTVRRHSSLIVWTASVTSSSLGRLRPTLASGGSVLR